METHNVTPEEVSEFRERKLFRDNQRSNGIKGAEDFRAQQRMTAIIETARQRCLAVNASYGVTVPVTISIEATLSAWTDFESITANYPISKMPDMKSQELTNQETLIDLLGILYHEAGHIRWSVPFIDLCVDAHISEAGGSSQRQHAIERIKAQDQNHSFSVKFQTDYVKYKRAWNALEDQRMETQQVEASPILATYFTSMILTHFLERDQYTSLWTLLAGREYLPQELRDAMKAAFPGDADRCLEIVNEYKAATRPKAMWAAVEKFYEFCESLGSNNPLNAMGLNEGWVDHHIDGNGPVKPGDGNAASEKYKGAPKPGDEKSDDKSDEGRGFFGSDEKSDKEEYDTVPLTEMEIRKLIEEQHKLAQDEAKASATFQSFKSQVIRGMHNAEYGIPTPTEYRRLDAKYETIATRLANPIEKAIEIAASPYAPMWLKHQKRGVLRPIDFVTRKPNNMEFYRHWTGKGEEKVDVTVSLLLDMSTSMDGRNAQVGCVDYACGLACQALGVPYRSMVFGSVNQYLLLNSSLNGKQLKSWMPPTLGGTNPSGAFDVLNKQEVPTDHHLIVVYTDGAFAPGTNNIRHYQWPTNTYSICLIEGGGSSAKKVGFDEAINISDLNEIPRRLEGFLERFIVR